MTQSSAELSAQAKQQLRVPKGSGLLSGRYVDDPRTSVEDLADKLEKAGNAQAAQVARNTATQLAGLVPGGPGWFTGIDAAIGDLSGLGGLDDEQSQLVSDVSERLFWLQVANWTDDFSELGTFEEDWDNDFPVDWQSSFPA